VSDFLNLSMTFDPRPPELLPDSELNVLSGTGGGLEKEPFFYKID
jgi:hypothetical protein